jgi:colanic acid biosynthesis glycosyl transferase WcaI
MAEGLAEAGHEVAVIAGQPFYPAWRTLPGHNALAFSRSREHGVDVTRVPHYVPRRPTGIRRVLHQASFAAAAMGPLLARAVAMRPDVVIAIAPSLLAAPLAGIVAKLCGARSWLHVQDFEVDAALALGFLGPGGGIARRFERAVLAGFDRVSTLSPAMQARLADKGVPGERITELRNWADAAIRPLPASQDLRNRLGIETPHVALYSGTLATKQGLDILVTAARRLEARADLTVVVCGDGAGRAQLAHDAKGLANLRLIPLQPREILGELLALASVHLLPQRADAADLVLPSKLANMLAAGRPVVATAGTATSLACEVEGCGLVTPPGDAAAFADAIAALLDDRALYARTAAEARRRAEERWKRQRILADFETELLALTAARARTAETAA